MFKLAVISRFWERISFDTFPLQSAGIKLFYNLMYKNLLPNENQIRKHGSKMKLPANVVLQIRGFEWLFNEYFRLSFVKLQFGLKLYKVQTRLTKLHFWTYKDFTSSVLLFE